MELSIGDQVQVSIQSDQGLTLVTGEVTLVGIWKPDVMRFEIAGLNATFYTDDKGLTVKVVG
jgi:protein involved in polysaccharide export with SLBB domain